MRSVWGICESSSGFSSHSSFSGGYTAVPYQCWPWGSWILSEGSDRESAVFLFSLLIKLLLRTAAKTDPWGTWFLYLEQIINHYSLLTSLGIFCEWLHIYRGKNFKVRTKEISPTFENSFVTKWSQINCENLIVSSGQTFLMYLFLSLKWKWHY